MALGSLGAAFLTSMSYAVWAGVPDYTAQVQTVYDEFKDTQLWYYNKRTDGTHFKTLKAMSYNIGLLNTRTVKSPNYKRRSALLKEVMSKFLQDEQPDVVFIQELWHEKDFNNLLNVTDENGYVAAIRAYDSWGVRHIGQQIFVKKNILEPGTDIGYLQFKSYGENAWWESSYFGNIHRGLLSAYITLKGSKKKILLGNTHFTPMLSVLRIPQAAVRQEQAKMLTSYLKELFYSPDHPADYVLLGGDFNASPDSTSNELGAEENKLVYLDFYAGTHLLDTYRAVHSFDDYQNTLVKERIDFVFLGNGISEKLIRQKKGNMFYVKDARLVLDSPIEGDDIYMSDHPGWISEVVIFSHKP